MAKKKSSKKKQNKVSFNAEYHNLVTIFIGIFLLYSLNSGSRKKVVKRNKIK